MSQVVIVEDDRDLREALVDTLTLANYKCIAFESAEKALIFIESMEDGMIVSDVSLEGMSGHALLTVLAKKRPDLPVLLMTAFGTIKQAVDALQKGAVDYLIKPFNPDMLVNKVSQYIRYKASGKIIPIAQDTRSKHLLSLALRVAHSDATVLITGPSGAGKEVLANYIHDCSPRNNHPFIAINCAAIPENMLEATLFGYEKGAFTGAYQQSPGKFEQAQHGTLLLDEVSEMELGLQAKLLRVLQEREVERLGGKKIIDLNVRVIATSNRDLEQMVAENKFREDLYYRLNVFPIHWLPLKERSDDILPLAEHLLARLSQDMNRVKPSLSNEAKQIFQQYDWPGNAREMSNVIQRALILQAGEVIEATDLQLRKRPIAQDKENGSNKSHRLSDDLKTREYQRILEVLATTNGNRQQAADQLGISPRTLRYKLAKMRELGMAV